jgi:FkbM family methyltransferase
MLPFEQIISRRCSRAGCTDSMSIRQFAEHLSRGIVFRRHLPARFRSLPMYVTPEAGLRYWWRMSRVDPLLFDMAEELVHPGSVVWDVGANVGLFSFCAAARAGRDGFVLAIEPDCWLASLISRSARALDRESFGSSNVEVLCAAVSDSCHVSRLEVAERARASNHLVEAIGSSQASATRYTQPTAVFTLDSLLEYFPPPTVLKIDVETHEARVLLGAQKLLNEIRPTIWCEVDPANSEDVTKLLHAAGYELYGAQSRPHPPTNRAWFHTLAVPRAS